MKTRLRPERNLPSIHPTSIFIQFSIWKSIGLWYFNCLILKYEAKRLPLAQKIQCMERIKRIALVAHDNRKKDLIEWVEWNWQELINHDLVCTGTTGKLVEETLMRKAENKEQISIRKLKSGPLGGDQQLGAMCAEGKIDMVIFFWDPMQPQPHEMDVKALLRITVLYNVPTACNRSTADFMISSPLFRQAYKKKSDDYKDYVNRKIS